MRIRTRMLLLGLLPLPVILGLTLLQLVHAVTLVRDARTVVAETGQLRAAERLFQALIAQRDGEAARASEESKGLEALMFSPSAPSSSSQAARGEPVPRALEGLRAALGSKADPDLASALAQTLAAGSAFEAPGSESSIEAVFVRYGDYLESFADDAAVAGNVSGDTRWAQRFAELAALLRLQNGLAEERMALRHALDTLSIDQSLARRIAAAEARIRGQRTALLIVGARTRSAAEAAVAQADAGGRARLLTNVDGYAKRSDLISELSALIGFGGFIHEYKNYILTGSEPYRTKASVHMSAALDVVHRMEVGSLSAEERGDVTSVEQTLSAFSERLDKVAALKAKGLPADVIEREVHVDDTAVENALPRLRTFRADLSAAQWDALAASLQTQISGATSGLIDVTEDAARTAQSSAQRSAWGGLIASATTLVLLALLSAGLYRRVSGSISALVSELQRVADSGDVRTRAVVTGTDELADLSRSIQRVTGRLDEMAGHADRLAEGDLTRSINILGPEDRLGMSLRALTASLQNVVSQAQRVAAGQYNLIVETRGERDPLAHALHEMGVGLRRYEADNARVQRLSGAQLAVLAAMREVEQDEALARAVLRTLRDNTQFAAGGLFAIEDGAATVKASLGTPPGYVSTRVPEGAGLVSLALDAAKTQVVPGLPAGFLRLVSSVGEADAPAVTLTPLRAFGRVVGAIELGWLGPPSADALELLDRVAEPVGISLIGATARAKTEMLLVETREQAARLQRQQADLRRANTDLQEQTDRLRQSEEELTAQQEELRTSNEELAERGQVLERQRSQLEATARELEAATRYKSEFLANMSHELRTPLNSLLILSKQLADNEDRNLSADQVQAATIIYEGGRDLLSLINDILDLSKVEAGRLDIHLEDCTVRELMRELERHFRHQAQERGVEFSIEQAADAPRDMRTDRLRFHQILRNLLANAFKFTSKGSVRLLVSRASPPGVAAGGEPWLSFAVEDTGVGIPPERFQAIFEAFQQADGSTSRKYGGTGLGLTIARQLAALLGGRVEVRSEVGKGSTFTLFLPARSMMPTPLHEEEAAPADVPNASPQRLVPETAESAKAAPVIADDRAELRPGERSILVIEDDLAFAGIVRDLARKHGFKCLVAGDGQSGLWLAREYRPSAIILDLLLPDSAGMSVLETLKWSGSTRHIPVHIVSASEPSTEPLRRGAIGFLQKPVEATSLQDVLSRLADHLSREKTVLVIEDDGGSQRAVRSLLENSTTHVITAGTGSEAMRILAQESIDCIVLDLALPDMDGFTFLEKMPRHAEDPAPPVIVYTARELTQDEHRRLSELASSIVIKGAASPERLLDEVVLFLHEVEDKLPEAQRQIVTRLHHGTDALQGKKVLLVDDDLRNTFALSAALKKRGLEVAIADDGSLALSQLENAGVDIILMDMMMPVMDGLEATRRIRALPAHAHTPIIMLTARAMPEDQRQCMEAGASDYLSKPLDFEQLLVMIRMWLSRSA